VVKVPELSPSLPGAPNFHVSEITLLPDKSSTVRTVRPAVPNSNDAYILIDGRPTVHNSMRIHPTLHKSHGDDHPRPGTSFRRM
jgi:hypothetical protein